MEYTYWELLTYLYIYGFLGWAVEVCVIAVRERRSAIRESVDGLRKFQH